MAVAAGLDGNPGSRLVLEVLRHHRGGAAQEGERAYEHSPVALRNKLGHAGAVAGRQDCHGVAFGG